MCSFTICWFLANVIVLCTCLLGSSYAFITPPYSTRQCCCAYHMSSSSLLHATITKRQTYILDGAELSYYIQSLASSSSEERQLLLPNLAPRSPRKCNRVGSVTFVTATLDNDVTREEDADDDSVWLAKGTQIIGVQVASNSSDSSSSTALVKKKNSNVAYSINKKS